MIKLSNGQNLDYVTASGAMAFDGNGWPWEKLFGLFFPRLFNPRLYANVIKTLTLKPRKGNLHIYNPFGCIKPIWKNHKLTGIVNAVGLTNPGIDWWINKIGPKVDSKKNRLIGSIFGTPDEILQMAGMLNPFDLVALEINVSCPNTGENLGENTAKAVESCRLAKGACRFPIIIKLSVANDALRIAQQLSGIVEAISINSVPWKTVFPDRKSPLEHLGSGGVSGKIAQAFEWELIDRLNGVTDIPIIGSGVWDFADIQTLRDNYFVNAISFGSVFIPYPWRPALFVAQDKKRRI